jgi:hypothetical protein
MRGYFLESGKNIILDRGVSPLINGQAGSGMRIEKTAETFVYLFSADYLLYPGGNINELHGAGGGNGDFSLWHGDPLE